MRILHLTGKDYQVGHWSGGTTTELFIWPEDADYSKRAFRFRISSAAVELPESDFTCLAGVQRYITPLTGGFTLTHPGKPAVVMAPLDPPYAFSGEEDTHCVGQATDFNLMLKGVPGEMTVCTGKAAVLPGFNSFYAVSAGDFVLDRTYRMQAGDLLVIFAEEPAVMDLGDNRAILCRAGL